MVCERHDQIQCPSTAVCRPVDVLDYVESSQQIAQSSSIIVVHIVDTDVDVTADDDRTGVDDKYLQHRRQFIVESRRWSNRARPVDV